VGVREIQKKRSWGQKSLETIYNQQKEGIKRGKLGWRKSMRKSSAIATSLNREKEKERRVMPDKKSPLRVPCL